MPPVLGAGVVVLLPEPEPMPLDPGVVGLVVVPVELEPLVLPEAPLPALPLDELPLRASRWHLSRSVPVRPTHLLASLPDAPDAAPAEPDAPPEVELSLLPEDEPLADGVLELPLADGVLELPLEDGADGVAEGVLAPPDAPAPVLPEDAPLLPLLEPED